MMKRKIFWAAVAAMLVFCMMPQAAQAAQGAGITTNVTDINGGVVESGDILIVTVTVHNTGTVSGNDDFIRVVLSSPVDSNLTIVPGSLEVTSGANTGAKTDAAGDDQGEYVAATRTVLFRLGTGADATTGGTLIIDESTTVQYRVTVNAGASFPITLAAPSISVESLALAELWTFTGAAYTIHHYALSASPASIGFGSLAYGYAQPAAQTVTIENTGSETETIAEPAGTGADFTLGALTKKLLLPGETAEFTVQPKAGLAPGTYLDTVTVNETGHGLSAAVNVSFTVQTSSDASLSGLAISKGTLAPAFAPGTFNYTAAVDSSVDSLSVTPTASDASASITVNGKTVASGAASGPIPLSGGKNTIPVVVTAQDSSTKTYSIVVTKASDAPSATPSAPSATPSAPSATPGVPSSTAAGGSIQVTAGTTQMYVGGRTTLTPAVTGGTWHYDNSMVSLKENADGTVTVTALTSGTAAVHYTVGWAEADVTLTIGSRAMPQTGQDSMPVYILLILAGCSAAGAAVYGKKLAKS